MATPLALRLRQLSTHDAFGYSLRVALAMGITMLVCWSQDQLELLIPLFLGIIASGLAETDDHWAGRLRGLLATLISFAISSLSVELLFPWPWAFAAGLALATFGLTMLGALGERYATLASATLILSIYTMIGVDQRGPGGDLWHEPLLLVIGAAGYGLLSVLWQLLFGQQPVQLALARVFDELAIYLKLKAAMFEPLREMDVEKRRLALARQNAALVTALNAAKEIILHRVGKGRSHARLNAWLKLYFIAQDIHERASSSHYPYNELAEAFFHSDVLFRCQLLLRRQVDSCRALASAIRLGQPFDHLDDSEQARADLLASLAHLEGIASPPQQALLPVLHGLTDNLDQLQQLLASASHPELLAAQPDSRQDHSLLDREPQTLREAIARIRLQLTPSSLLFRHALRLSLALAGGYGLLHLIHPTQGYWILLTTVFVCQPSYGATRTKLVQRITGTLLGLIAGWALFDLVPDARLQALIAVIAGVAFFATRRTHYMLATASITLMVLFCFNQTGNGYILILPRLFDTLLGSLIAGLAVFLILPDWQGRRLHVTLANTLNASARYLRQIIQQYRHGKRDDLDYRLARRNAHNADAALSAALASMGREPQRFRQQAELGLRFLALSHTLLNYFSALGAHRSEQPLELAGSPALAAGDYLCSQLELIAGHLGSAESSPPAGCDEEQLARSLQQAARQAEPRLQLLCGELALACRQLQPLREAADRVLAEG